MKIFVFDTETTGFINKKDPRLEAQPKIVQFAGIFGELRDDGLFEETKRCNILINPEVPIPYAASQVHHIYDLDVKDAPVIGDVIDEMLSYINDADMIIGHNIEYDEDMIKVELRRLEAEYKYQPKQTFCTMKTQVDFCAIQWNGARFKYPKLGELHKKLFNKYFIGAHDAMTDVEATLNCFVELVKLWEIQVTTSQVETMSLF